MSIPPEPVAYKSPVFIIGNPRSGTTLLRLMLACHPQIAIPPEGGVLIGLRNQYGNYAGEEHRIAEFARDVVAYPKMDSWDIGVNELAEFVEYKDPRKYSELVSAVYEYYAVKHQKGKTRWGDKNNYYLNHIPSLAKMFSQAKFVHIVRDGRDVACSYRDLAEVQGTHAPDLPSSVLEAAKHWKDNLLRIRRGFEKIGWKRVCEVKYEELVSSPAETLRRVCNFLGEPYSDEMLEFADRNKEEELEPQAFDAWKHRNKQALTTSRVQRWRMDMFKEDVILFESQAENLLDIYSYRKAALGGSMSVYIPGKIFGALSSLNNLSAISRRIYRGVKSRVV